MIRDMIYGGIRGVTQLVGTGVDVLLAQLAPVLGDSVPGPEREALIAALNGIFGDSLHQSGNPLALAMTLRSEGRALDLNPESLLKTFALGAGEGGVDGKRGNKLLVLAHGSSMNDLQWQGAGHDHGAALDRDLGYTPVYLLYNSGLHISTNGRAFSSLLEQLVAAWPVELDEVVLLGHSMGGLVARSACHYAEHSGARWRKKLRHLITLGTPHHGAPLERGGSWLHLLLGISRYSAPLARLGQIRSAGVTDLAYGNLIDEDWQGRERFTPQDDPRRHVPLPKDVVCWAIAGITPLLALGPLAGDGLVPVDSALGRHPLPHLITNDAVERVVGRRRKGHRRGRGEKKHRQTTPDQSKMR